MGLKIKRRPNALEKKARKGFRGYPMATLAFYGPDNTKASKVAVGVVTYDGAEADPLERWFSEDGDVRHDPVIGAEIIEFIGKHGVKSVVMSDGLMGCPHEEEIDYPLGEVCPQCPYWAIRDRFTGEIIQ